MQQGFMCSKVMRRQQLLAKQLEQTAAVLAKISCSQASVVEATTEKPKRIAQMVFDDMSVEKVVWDEEVQDMLDQPGLLKQLALGGDNFVGENRGSAEQNQVPIQATVIWDGAIQGGLAELQHIDVVWDDEFEQDQRSHGGLLQQLASGQEYFHSEQMAINVEHTVENVDFGVDTNAIDVFLLGDPNIASIVFDEMTNKDVIWDEDLSPEMDSCGLSHGQLYGVNACASDKTHLVSSWTGDKQMLSDLETQDSSVHQQAMCAGYMNDKIKPTIELSDDKLLISVGGLPLSLEQSMEDIINLQQFQFSTINPEKLGATFRQDTIDRPDQLGNKSQAKILREGDSNRCGLSKPYGFRPLNNGAMLVEEIPTWMYGGFSPGKMEQQLGKYRMIVGCVFGAYMIRVDYKRAAIFVRTLWDPGIWRFIIRELVLECSMWMIILLSRRWTPSHEPDKLFVKRFYIFISWQLMAFFRDGYALQNLHWKHQVVYCLYTSLAWGQASFSGGGPRPSGARKASLDFRTTEVAAELGYQEVGHIRAIRQAVGGFPRPAIDLGTDRFAMIMDDAMGARLDPPFDPYNSTVNFLLASYLFPHVTAAATMSISSSLMGFVSKRLQSSILAVEAGQDAVIRLLLYQHADEVVQPYQGHTVADFTRRISEWRNRMSGCGAKDEGVKVLDRQQGAERRTISNILGAGEDSLGFQRTPAEVLRILYGSRNEQIPGGFLPRGANGTIARGFFQLA